MFVVFENRGFYGSIVAGHFVTLNPDLTIKEQ